MTKQTVFIIAKEGFDTGGDTVNMVIDSRRLTFKYLDRSKYHNGVYPVNITGFGIGATSIYSIVIPHGLNYAPSTRIYAAGNIETPSTGVVSSTRIVTEPGFQAASPYIICTSDTRNVYIDVLRGNSFGFPKFDIILLIGADNLDSKADEDVYL